MLNVLTLQKAIDIIITEFDLEDIIDVDILIFHLKVIWMTKTRWMVLQLIHLKCIMYQAQLNFISVARRYPWDPRTSKEETSQRKWIQSGGWNETLGTAYCNHQNILNQLVNHLHLKIFWSFTPEIFNHIQAEMFQNVLDIKNNSLFTDQE